MTTEVSVIVGEGGEEKSQSGGQKCLKATKTTALRKCEKGSLKSNTEILRIKKPLSAW
jgi:hypothetical protein